MCRIVSLIALTVFLASCASGPYKPYAREVKKKPGVEGVIALKPDYVPEDRTYADSLMTKNCGSNPFTVLEEGEVEIGQTTTANSQVRDEKEDNGVELGGFKFLTGGQTDVKNKAETKTTVAVKEWQIAYNCGAVAKTDAKKANKKK